MKIATYNIHLGGKHQNWAKLIEDHSCDLLLIQESRSPYLLLSGNMNYNPSKFTWAWKESPNNDPNDWGSAIYSNSGKIEQIFLPGFEGWVAGAKITGAPWQKDLCDPLTVFSVHTPPYSGSSKCNNYLRELNKILDEIGKMPLNDNLIIGGDFNANITYGEELKPVIRKKDLHIHKRLSDEFGLINCWRAANSGKPVPTTFRGPKMYKGEKISPKVFALDAVLVPGSWKDRLVSCDVLSGGEWDELSDHYPVVAGFA